MNKGILAGVALQVSILVAYGADIYDPPRLIAPQDGWTISCKALSFRFNPPAAGGANDTFRTVLGNQVYLANSSSANAFAKDFVDQEQIYALTIATDSAFNNTVFDSKIFIWGTQHGGAQYIPEQVLPPGTYWWRMRCQIDGGGSAGTSPWTAARQIVLVDEAPAAMRYTISNENPLFVVADALPVEDTIAGMLPAGPEGEGEFALEDSFALDSFSPDMRKHVAVCYETREKGSDRFLDVSRSMVDDLPQYDRLVNAGYKVMLFHMYSLCEHDWFYRHYTTNAIGTFTGETENLSDYPYYRTDGVNAMDTRYYHRSVEMADQHGGYFMNAVMANPNRVGKDYGGFFFEQAEIDFMRAHGSHIIFGSKDTNTNARHYNNALWYGLWLDGLIGNRCHWMEHYHQRDSNVVAPAAFPLAMKNGLEKFFLTLTPMSRQAQEMAHAAAMGTTVYITRDNRNVQNAGENLLGKQKHLFQLFEKLIRQNLIPSLADARDFNKVAVKALTADQFAISATDNPPQYRDYWPLFNTLYSLDTYADLYLTDLIPGDGGRYRMVPIVPPGETRPAAWNCITKTVADLDTAAKVQAVFNNAFPTPTHTGDAWVNVSSNLMVVVNSVEGQGRAVTQTYNIALGDGSKFIDGLKGNIEANTYIFAKTQSNGNELWITCSSHRFDEYDGRMNLVNAMTKENTILEVVCDEEPIVEVTPAGALVGTSWDTNSKTMAIEIQHREADDLPEVVVYSPANSAPVFTADPINKAGATEDVAYSETISGSATDADSDPLAYSAVAGPSWLSIASNGALSGTPANSDVGANSWTVQVSDGKGGTDTATLNITVINVYDAPVFTADPISKANAAKDAAYTGQTLADSTTPDAGGATLTYSKVSGPVWLSVAANGALSGTPGAGDVGANSWTVQVSDGLGGIDTAVLNITVDALAIGWTELTSDDFESGFGNWVSGGIEAVLSSDYAIGVQCVNIQNNTGDASSFWLTGSLDLSSYSQLKIAFTYMPISMDNVDEDFWVQFSDDGGSSWTTIKAFILDTDFVNGTRENPELIINSGSYNFTSNVKIKFRCDAGGVADDVYIDNVVISGYRDGPGVQRFADWIAQFPTLGTMTNAMDNPDGDALNNLYEFALGGIPTNGSHIGLVPVFRILNTGGANWFEYVYARRKTAAGHGLTYYLLKNSNLVFGAWGVASNEVVGVGTMDDDFEAVTNRFLTDGRNAQFIRLKVEEP